MQPSQGYGYIIFICNSVGGGEGGGGGGGGGEGMQPLMVYEKIGASPLRQTTPRRQIRTVPTYWLTGTNLLLQI